MALTKQGNFSQQPSELPDVPSPSMTPDQIRAKWQTPLDEFKTTFNNAIDKLNSTTDGASGADNVGATGFDGTPSTTQTLLETLNANKATKGADWTGTWQGYTPSKADPGISSVVEQHTAQLAEMSQNAFSKLMQDMLNGLSVTIDCRGDSTYLGFLNAGTQAAIPPPLQLQNTLRTFYNSQNITVINNGIGGNQTTNALRTWDNDMASSPGQIIYINYGINDAEGGNPAGVSTDPKIDAQQFYINMKKLVSIARKHGKIVILETPNPVTYDSSDSLGSGQFKTESTKQFAEATRQVAMELNVPLVDNFNLYSKYITGLKNIYNALQPGGIHPTEEGYKVKGTNMALPLIHAKLPVIKSESFIPIGEGSTQVDSPDTIISNASRSGYCLVSTTNIRFTFFVDVPEQDIYIATPLWDAGDTDAIIKIDGSQVATVDLNANMIGTTGIGIDQEILIIRDAKPGLHVLELIGNSVGMYYLRSRKTREKWVLSNDSINNTITKRDRIIDNLDATFNSTDFSHFLLDVPTTRTLENLDVCYKAKFPKNTGIVLFGTPIGPDIGFSPHGGLYIYLNNNGYLCVNEGDGSTGYLTETVLNSVDLSTTSHIFRVTVTTSGSVTIYLDGTQIGTYIMTKNRCGGFLGIWADVATTLTIDWLDLYS